MMETRLLPIPRSSEVPHLTALDLIDIDEVCRIVGGSKPVNRATIYRGITAGRWPKPLRVGPNVSRWVKAEWLAIIEARLVERGEAA